jgi:hypothetical protein
LFLHARPHMLTALNLPQRAQNRSQSDDSPDANADNCDAHPAGLDSPASHDVMKNQLDLPRPVVRCLTKHEAAQYLGIGISLFEGLRIPAVRFGRRCVYDRFDLDAWLDEYKQRARTEQEVNIASTAKVIRGTDRLQLRHRTAAAYAKALGLTTASKKRKRS